MKKYQLLIFPILSILWFAPSAYYGIASDFIGWIYKYKAGDYGDVIHCFGYNGLHQVFHLINYTFFRIFGSSHIAWFLWFALLHGINAMLVFTLVKRWKERWDISANHLEWFVALCFLLSPYQVEVVTWKACMHYLLSMMSLLGGMLLLISYLNEPTSKKIWSLLTLYFLSLFVLEINLSAPFILMCFIIMDRLIRNETGSISNNLKLISAPMLGLTVLYFMMNKIILGAWVGHYGAEKHLGVSIMDVLGHGWRYLVKYLGFIHYLNFELREDIYQSVSHGFSFFIIFGVLIAILIYALDGFNKIDRSLKLSGTALVMFFMALVPILSLYFFYVTPYANDRYSYYASPFFFISFLILIYKLPFNWRYAVLILYLGLNMIHSRNMITSARTTGKGLDYMLTNFPCDAVEGKDVFLLALPDNYRGNYFYRNFTDDADTYVKSMDLFHPDKNCNAKIWHNPIQYNVNYGSDGIKAYFENDTTIRVFMAQNGTWFMRKGIGLSDYETETYKVENKGWYCLVHLKNPNDNTVYYVPNGAEWSEVILQ